MIQLVREVLSWGVGTLGEGELRTEEGRELTTASSFFARRSDFV